MPQAELIKGRRFSLFPVPNEVLRTNNEGKNSGVGFSFALSKNFTLAPSSISHPPKSKTLKFLQTPSLSPPPKFEHNPANSTETPHSLLTNLNSIPQQSTIPFFNSAPSLQSLYIPTSATSCGFLKHSSRDLLLLLSSFLTFASMAVASSAAVSPARKTSSKKRKATEGPEVEMVLDSSDPKQDSVLENPKQPKRTKSPGVRVVGGRIYDSSNGKTCHQCRQKTLDFAAACKNTKNDKPCTMKLCHKCLLNRYGEKAEEVALLDDWKCPKCRGICNCSFCMKKRGCQPTGILIHSAKASGYTSVSEMLIVQSPGQEEIAKSKGATVASPKKLGKENKYDAADNKVPDCQLQAHSKKFKKVTDLAEKKDANGVKNESKKTEVVKKVKKDLSEVKSDNKIKGLAAAQVAKKHKDISKVKNDQPKESTEICQVNKVKRKNSTKMKKVKESTEISDAEKAQLKELTEICGTKRTNAEELANPEKPAKKKAKLHPSSHDVVHEKPKVVEIILPDGNELINVAEVDLLPEDAGNALQFIEFCYTFGEVLEIRKGQAESVLRDMMLGRTRRGKVSSLVHFQIHLLTLMREEMEEESPLSPTDGEDCWLHALKEFVTEAEGAAKELAALDFDRTSQYDILTSSEKLKLLVFLCDETLETLKVRNWMEEQNLKFSEKKKEGKEKLLAAKEKEKLMKGKLQDEFAKAIIAKKGTPLSISEHEAMVLEMKAKSKLAHAEMLETMGLVPKYEQIPAAVRIEPVLIDSKGHTCWRLKGCSKLDLLRQDIEDRDGDKASDKWFSYEDKEIQVVNEYISFSRSQKHKRCKTKVLKVGNLNPKIDSNQITDNANGGTL